MAYSNKEDSYWSSQSLANDFDGSKIEVRNVVAGVFGLSWSDADATDAVVKVQESVDGVTGWEDISGKSVTIAAASGSKIIKLTRDELLSPYVRLVIVANSETAGTVTARYFFKGDR